MPLYEFRRTQAQLLLRESGWIAASNTLRMRLCTQTAGTERECLRKSDSPGWAERWFLAAEISDRRKRAAEEPLFAEKRRKERFLTPQTSMGLTKMRVFPQPVTPG